MSFRFAVASVLVLGLVPGGLSARAAGVAQDPATPNQTVEEFRMGAYAASAEDVSEPVALRRVSPRYTREAMQLKLQGVVELEAVVDTDGRVDRVRVTRSLDALYGLDETALEAAKQWRFEPGRHAGMAVPVYVTLVLEFRIHD